MEQCSSELGGGAQVHLSCSTPLGMIMVEQQMHSAKITEGFEKLERSLSLWAGDVGLVARSIPTLLEGLKDMNSRYQEMDSKYKEQISENHQIRQVLMEIKARLPRDPQHWSTKQPRSNSARVQQCRGDGLKFSVDLDEDSDPSLEFLGPDEVPDEVPKLNGIRHNSMLLDAPSSNLKDPTKSKYEEDDGKVPSGKQARISMEADHDEDSNQTVEVREAEGMLDVFTENLDPEAPSYHVEDYYYKAGACQAIARSRAFGNLTIIVVMLNALYLGIDSDWNDAANIYDANPIFQICSQAFAIYFTLELLVRFLAYQDKISCLQDGWFKFDAFLVATMVLDIWILMPLLKAVAGSNVIMPTQPLRMLRLFKLSRMARLMKHFPELVTMIKGLLRSLRAIASSMVLVSLMVYTWAILIHMLLKGDREFNSHVKEEHGFEFSKVGDCMWALLMAGTLMLDNAAYLMADLLFNKDAMKVMAGIAFILYTFLSAFLILQMLIGVLTDVVARVGQERRAAESVGLVRQELLGDLQQMDKGDGKLTMDEFKIVLETPKSKRLLKKLNINKLFLMEIIGLMYPQKTSAVPIRAIMEIMLMCKGDNPCTVQIISSALCFLSNEISEMQETINSHTSNIHAGRLENSPSKRRGLLTRCANGDF